MFLQLLNEFVRFCTMPDSGKIVNQVSHLYEWLIMHGYTKDQAIEHIKRVIEEGINITF